MELVIVVVIGLLVARFVLKLVGFAFRAAVIIGLLVLFAGVATADAAPEPSPYVQTVEPSP